MKYTNMLNKLGIIAWKGLNVIIILVSIALFGLMAYFSIWLQTLILAVMIMPMMIVFLGLVLNFQMEILSGGELYNTGLVHEGNSIINVKKGPGYYKRKKFVDFIQCVLFVCYIVYFAFNMQEEIGWAIGGIVVFLIGAVLYFMAGLSSIEKEKMINK